MNCVYYGQVAAVEGEKARVKVNTTLMTDFLPVFQVANSYKVSYTPLRVGEQCVVLAPFGEVNTGVILRGIYYTKHQSPECSQDKEITVYEDGTSVSYDVKDSKFEINAVKDINIVCKNAVLSCDSATVTAKSVVVDSPSVELGGKSGGGDVVTTHCICSLTGLVHPEGSKIVRALKG